MRGGEAEEGALRISLEEQEPELWNWQGADPDCRVWAGKPGVGGRDRVLCGAGPAGTFDAGSSGDDARYCGEFPQEDYHFGVVNQTLEMLMILIWYRFF